MRTAERRPDLLENAFQISCACNEKEESSAWAHDLLAGMTRYGVSLDLGRKKIRKQKNLFDDHDLLILQLPGTLEEGMKAKSEYIRSFAGKETPLVFLCPDGFSEEEEKLEEQLEKTVSVWSHGLPAYRPRTACSGFLSRFAVCCTAANGK